MRKRRTTMLILSILLSALTMGMICTDEENSPLPHRPGDNYPGEPYDPYPEHNRANQSRSPLFSWKVKDAASDPLHFKITLKLYETEETVWEQEDIFAYEIQYPETLSAETHYLWHVTVYDAEGEYHTGSEWMFRTGTNFNNPPVRPFNLYPEFDQEDVFDDVVLIWNCFDPDGDPLTYEVYFGVDPDPPLASGGQPEQSYAPVTLLPDTTYYWWILADDGRGGSASSGSIFRFRTADVFSNPPVAPSDPDPADDATGVTRDVTLRWTCSDPDGDPLVYDVYMGTAGGTLFEIGSDLGDDSLEVTGLEYETGYDWHVDAEDDHGLRTQGPLWSFTTGAHPGAWQGVYAEMIVHRSRYLSETTEPGTYETIRVDHFSARFDSVYAPAGYIHAMQPAGVNCSEVGATPGRDLWWDDAWKWYFYNNPVSGYFLGPGTEYVFTVSAGGGVPALTADPILFPLCGMTLTDPLPFSFVSRDGFTLLWSGNTGPDCPSTVRIRIQDASMQEWTPIDVETANDGSYTFTAGDLSALDPMVYQISVVLMIGNTEQIVAPGYDPRGFVRAQTWSTVMLYLDP